MPGPTATRFHPSLGIPLITTLTPLPGPTMTPTFPSLFRDSSDHHQCSAQLGWRRVIVFPSLFRDSSDHHGGNTLGSLLSIFHFHPSLGIPLITTCSKWFRTSTDASFPSLFRDSSDHHHGHRRRHQHGHQRHFHPSLGIPLITTEEVEYHGVQTLP